MSTDIDSRKVQSYTTRERASNLRAELKRWEKEFAETNDGRKAARDDVKSNSTIAQKYKEYSKLKDILTGKTASTTRPTEYSQERYDRTPSKRKCEKGGDCTPQRLKFPRQTPTKQGSLESIDKNENDTELTPQNHKTFVGPTPQKDGRILGLFDVTPQKEPNGDSDGLLNVRESKLVVQNEPPLNLIPTNLVDSTWRRSASITETKSLHKQQRLENVTVEDITHKNVILDQDLSPATPVHHKKDRTPQSLGKRYLLATFGGTPSKRQRTDDAVDSPNNPTKKRVLHADFGLGTPTFLRRESQQANFLTSIAEENDIEYEGGEITASPSATAPKCSTMHTGSQVPSGRPHFARSRNVRIGRTLSSMITDLRKAEDERLDDEMDILREMEGEYNTTPLGKHDQSVVNEDLMPDGHFASVLGPDGIGRTTDDELENATQAEQGEHQHRVHKKKGPKRQTRRVILRPRTQSKPKRTCTKDVQVLGETTAQSEFHKTSPASPLSENENDSNAEFGSEMAESSKATGKEDAKEVGAATKAIRKISATAHANFRRLKIRGKGGANGSKGKWAGRGKRHR